MRLQPVQRRHPPCVGCIACIDRRCRLHEQNFAHAIQRDGAMFNPVRHDDELALPNHLISISEFHQQRAFMDKEKLILDLMVVPGKGAFKLGKLDMHIIDLANDFRAPAVRKLGKQIFQIASLVR